MPSTGWIDSCSGSVIGGRSAGSVRSTTGGRTVSANQILNAVWGYASYDDNLVHVHISSLRRKLEAHGPRILHTARGIGYRLETPRQ